MDDTTTLTATLDPINPVVQPASATGIQRDSVILYLSIGRLRTRRRISSSTVQSDIDPDMLHVSKDILQSPELQEIAHHDSEVRNWIRARCLPSPFSKKGLLLLPIRLIEPVMARLTAKREERQALIEKFILAYEHCKTAAIAKLGSAYDATDYPAEEAVRRTFFFDVQMWELNAPGKLAAVSQELYRQELVKMENMWTQASNTVTNVLLTEFRKLTNHLSDRMSEGIDGKKKVFRDSVVTNLTEWLDLFQVRNLTNDEQLMTIVEKAKRLISGLDPAELRESEDLRKHLSVEFSKLTTQIDSAIIDGPSRAIDLDF